MEVSFAPYLTCEMFITASSSVMKSNVRRHLGIKALTSARALTMETMRECIQLGFDDISEPQRVRLAKANFKDLLRCLDNGV